MAQFTVPNWAQALIAVGAGLDPGNVVVRHEDERNISFVQHKPRKDVTVRKTDGQKVESMDPYADKPKTAPVRQVAAQVDGTLTDL